MSKSKIKTLITEIAEEKKVPEEVVIDALKKSFLKGYRTEIYREAKSKNLKNNKEADKIDDSIKAEVDFDKKGNFILKIYKKVTKHPKLLLREISLNEAKKINEDVEEGDIIPVIVDFSKFKRNIIKNIMADLKNEINNYIINRVYNNLKAYEGKLVKGLIQRYRDKVYYVQLENAPEFEALLEPSEQSSLDKLNIGEKRLFLLKRVELPDEKKNQKKASKKRNKEPIIIRLSRSDIKFIENLFRQEVPEIADGTVEIVKITREVGYKTKVAVKSTKPDVEAVGSCIGMRGYRIQNIRKETGNEVIEVIEYDDSPEIFIKRALNIEKFGSGKVYIVNEAKKIAVVSVKNEEVKKDVIGKEGINVTLAVKITGWNIDIKTEEEFKNSEYYQFVVKSKASLQFDGLLKSEVEGTGTSLDTETYEESYQEIDEEESIDVLEEYLGALIIKKLKDNGINTIDKLIDYDSTERLKNLSNLTLEEYMKIKKFIDENIEIEEEEEKIEVEYIVCPGCNKEIEAHYDVCPYCNTKIEK